MSEYSDYDEFTKMMEDEFPEMFGKAYGGFSIGEGWRPIIHQLCRQIQHHINWKTQTRERLLKDNSYNHIIPDKIEPVIVEQIKEKFGGLRFYYSGGDDTIDGMVRMAEVWASTVCEKCGKPGKHRSGGWVRTLCDEHESEYQKNKNV